MTLNPLKWFSQTSVKTLKTAVKVMLRVAGITADVWTVTLAHVKAAEGENAHGFAKYQWATAAIIKLFPALAPAWVGFAVQLAWMLLEHTEWNLPKPEEEELAEPV